MQLLKLGLAELLGTAALVFVGVSAVAIFFGLRAVEQALPGYWPRIIGVLCCFGAIIAASIYSPVGRISGSHINPAVSIALAAWGKLPARLLAAYLPGQFIGGWLGAGLAALVWGAAAQAVNIAVTLPQPGWPVYASVSAEALGTALIILLIHAIERRKLERWAGLIIGVYIWVYGSLTAQISGASFNPARSLGPAIIAGDYNYLWLYLLVPTLGALAAALILARLNTQFTDAGENPSGAPLSDRAA
jgi:MIP family channel proteins